MHASIPHAGRVKYVTDLIFQRVVVVFLYDFYFHGSFLFFLIPHPCKTAKVSPLYTF